MDFVECFDDDNDAELAKQRHTDNLDMIDADPAPAKPIIPTPLKVRPPDPTKAHQIQITSDWTVVYDDERLRNEAVFIASKIQSRSPRDRGLSLGLGLEALVSAVFETDQ